MTSTPPSPNCGPREPRSRRRSPTSAGAWWPRSACPTARSFPSTSPSILRRTDPAAPAPLPSPSRSSVRGMTRLRVLFIGGSGVISSACSRVAVDSGIELFVLNRGRNTARPLPAAVNVLQADIREPGSVRDVINDLEFDAVVDWVAFTAGHVRTDIDLFRGRTGHYVFISSASAYQTPPARMPVTESTPLRNPYWQYSRDKIACEDLLVRSYREEGFPATIVRPSHTYDATLVPFDGGWTVLGRMLADKAHSMVFDNAKLRSIVPGWRAVIPFERGARQIVDWYLADPARQVTDAALDAVMDKLAAAWTV